MKRYISMLAAIALAGCATTGGVPSTGGGDVIDKIRQYAVLYCSFEPTISTISQIVASFGGPGAVAGEAVVEQVARSICAAVAPKKTARLRAKGPPPEVNGVVIHGRFVR